MAVGAVAQQPPGVDKVPHHAPLVGKEKSAPAASSLLLLLRTLYHLRAARPKAYHRVHAELGHVLLALGPGLVHPLERAQRRRAHPYPKSASSADGVEPVDGVLPDRLLRREAVLPEFVAVRGARLVPKVLLAAMLDLGVCRWDHIVLGISARSHVAGAGTVLSGHVG